MVGIFKMVIGAWVFLKYKGYWWAFVEITQKNVQLLLVKRKLMCVVLKDRIN